MSARRVDPRGLIALGLAAIPQRPPVRGTPGATAAATPDPHAHGLPPATGAATPGPRPLPASLSVPVGDGTAQSGHPATPTATSGEPGETALRPEPPTS